MQKSNIYIQYIVVIVIIILLNIIAGYRHTFWDLTEEKRYTLSPSTVDVVENLDRQVFIKVLLEGDFPAGFQRLQTATENLLADFNDINPNVQYLFEDPMDGNMEERRGNIDRLAEDGIHATSLKYFDGKEYVQKPIYPYALVSTGGRFTAINLLHEKMHGLSEEQVLNKSVELLEYKFANMLQKIQKEARENVVILTGHGELPKERTISMEEYLRQYYNVGRVNIDSVVVLDKEIDVLIVAGPRMAYGDKAKFKLDQYVMNGGKVMWLIDKYQTSLDSLSRSKFYIPEPLELNLDDLFFKYGFRLQPNIVMDLDASSIPQVEGQQGGEAQISYFKWFYHILSQGNEQHPISKNIGRVNVFDASSIDTIRTATKIKKTPLLTTSPNSRYQLYPMRQTFEILKIQPQTSQYNKGKMPVAYLLEGEFPSLFENRITPSFQTALNKLKIDFVAKSPVTKQIIVSDSDWLRNSLNYKTKTAERVGYNPWDKKYYVGNELFIQNCIEYLIDENGVLESRSKEIKLRPLDRVKTENEKFKWQLINLVLPLIFIALFGFLFYTYRRYKYKK